LQKSEENLVLEKQEIF